MEGIRLSTSRSYWILQRTPDTFPSFLNDIGQSMMEFVSEITRERVRFRANGYAPSLAVQSPNGSDDAFYIKIDKHYGSSDHVTYMQHGIPAVMFITWPDNWYHSSQDTPDKQDSTQYKRAAVVATGAMAVLATGGDEMAARVVSENLSRGAERMGESHRKALVLHRRRRERAVAGRRLQGGDRHHQASGGRREGRRAVGARAVRQPGGRREEGAGVRAADRQARPACCSTRRRRRTRCRRRSAGRPMADPAMTAEERDASTLFVECVNGSSFSGCSAAPGAGGGRGGPGGGGGGGGRGGGTERACRST